MSGKIKVQFKHIAEKYRGVILIQHYTFDGSKRCLAFTPIDPVQFAGDHKCGSCGLSEWNATNFGNPVHFCPDREIEIEVTDFRATPRHWEKL